MRYIWAFIVSFITMFFGYSPAKANNIPVTPGPDFEISTLQTNYSSGGPRSLYLTPLDNNLMGDSHDVDTGLVSFRHVDVSLPGNNALAVEFARRASGQSLEGQANPYAGPLGKVWDVDLPYVIYRKGPNGGSTTDALNIGTKLYIPGQGQQDLGTPINTAPVSYRGGATKGLWVSNVTHTTTANAYSVKSPSGTTYTFNHKKIRTTDFRFNDTANGLPTISVEPRDNHYLFPTQITDIHGNWVKYSYNSHGVTRIWSSDGREIDINYSGAFISSVSANNRIWTYQYNGDQLKRVTLPDSRYWTFGSNETGMAYNGLTDHDCLQKRIGTDVRFLHMRHPSGTSAIFETGAIHNGVTRTPQHPYGADAPWGGGYGTHETACSKGSLTPDWFLTRALLTKTLTLTSGEVYDWTYDYDQGQTPTSSNWPQACVSRQDGFCSGWSKRYGYAGHGDIKKRTFINPLGHKTVFHLNADWIYEQTDGVRLGSTIKRETFETAASTTPIETVTTDDWHRVQPTFGWSQYGNNVGTGSHFILPAKKTILRNGDTFTREYDYNLDITSAGFAYKSPIVMRSWSNYSISNEAKKRITTTTYVHDKTKWIFGLAKTQTRNGRLLWSVDYTPLGQVDKSYQYSQSTPVSDYDYHADGTLASVTDAIGRVTEADNWKRGKPQLITRAVGTSLQQSFGGTIDDNGWVMTGIDPSGKVTTFQRDAMGRTTRVIPHTPSVGFKKPDTVISYNFASTPIIQMITTGPRRDFIYYDSLQRPVHEGVYDFTTTELTWVRTKYDALGQVTFKSFPSTNAGDPAGINTLFDALGRIKESVETVAPFAKTKHRYLSSHRYVVTDPLNNDTVTYRYGYDGPDTGDSYLIRQEEDIDTYTYRNVHGEITRARQRGPIPTGGTIDKSQYYYYDANRRVCRHRALEGGNTVYQYNNANELTNYQKGLGAGTACSTPSGNDRVELTYDALGRPKATNFTDPATPDIWRDYDVNGNITKNYRGAAAAAVKWDYAYDSYNRLKSEHLTVDNRAYDLNYYYNAYGYKIRTTLPTGRNISYVNDGLGRNTQLKWGSTNYVNGGSYHPNGVVAGFIFGDGTDFTQTLNARQQVERFKVTHNGTDIQNLYFDYYADGRVKNKLDNVDSTYSTLHSYDAAGRLKTANSSAWGDASYSYDALGNLRSKTFNNLGAIRTVTNNYNSLNRIISSIDTANISYGFNYDNRGNVRTTGLMNFTYDRADQPISVSGPAPNTGTNITASYVYDGNLKRVKSVVNGKTIYNVYSAAGQLVHVDEVTDNKETDYLHGMGQTIARIKNGEFTYLHPDHLGSAQVATNRHGVVQWNERYTPFGEALIGNSANDNQAGFTGHIKDKSTGLNYMQARYYDPNIGRFLSIDPVTFIDTGDPKMFNRYAYANNDPINMLDPDGEASIWGWAVKRVNGGLKRIRPLPDETAAIKAANKGADIEAAGGLKSARAVAKSTELKPYARPGRKRAKRGLRKDKGHKLNDGSGKTGKDHFHNGKGSHIFYSFVGGLIAVLDVAEQLDPLYTGGLNCNPAEGCRPEGMSDEEYKNAIEDIMESLNDLENPYTGTG